MPLYSVRDPAPVLVQKSSAVVAFDSDLGRPIWLNPVTGVWVDATGQAVDGNSPGKLTAELIENSGLMALIGL